ncbi:MAG: hypothetical protein IPK13_26630 [Deltaproteobacteria bacterium]|nr:hypothetical protein [Deltaproteobacteria bacterium]
MAMAMAADEDRSAQGHSLDPHDEPNESPYDRLLEHADERILGPEANEAMWQRRSELEASFGRCVGYEIWIDPHVPWPTFLESTLARMREHFQAKRLPVLGDASVQLYIWRDEFAYRFSAQSFFKAISTIEDTDLRSLEQRIGLLRPPEGGDGETR